MKRKDEKAQQPEKRRSPEVRVTICPPGVAKTMPFQSCQFDEGLPRRRVRKNLDD